MVEQLVFGFEFDVCFMEEDTGVREVDGEFMVRGIGGSWGISFAIGKAILDILD